MQFLTKGFKQCALNKLCNKQSKHMDSHTVILRLNKYYEDG